MKQHLTHVTEHLATEPGALDGHKIVCDDCGPVASYSILSMSQSEARKHTEIMRRLDAKRK